MVPANRLTGAQSGFITPILTGPTASGKTAFALDLAARFGLEIINADSLLVYRGFDIGTAKPTSEELHRIPHHLVDICDPEENYTAAEFVADVNRILEDLQLRRKRALIVGGTPFYLKALTFGLWEAPPTQPEFRASVEAVPTPELFRKLVEQDEPHAWKIGPNDRYRIIRALEILNFSDRKPSQLEAEAKGRAPDSRFPLWVIDRPTSTLEERISLRTEAMLAGGLVDESQRLRQACPGARALGSVGYAQVLDYLDGKAPAGRILRPGLEGLSDEIRLATRQLVKAQRTFLKSLSHAQWFLFDEDRPRLEDLAKQTFEEP